MAIVRNNPLLMGVSGSIGKQITFRQLAGQTVMSKYRGPSSVPPTDAQLSVRGRFAKAVAFARRAKKDKTLAPLYQAAASLGHSAYHLALRDALSAPTISEINCNLHTGMITVTAKDIIEIHSVTISMRSAEGIVLEEGPARRKPGTDEWIYSVRNNQSRQAGTLLTAQACDYPGNRTLFSITLEDYVSTTVKATTAIRSNKKRSLPTSKKYFLPVSYIKYIERKSRAPGSIPWERPQALPTEVFQGQGCGAKPTNHCFENVEKCYVSDSCCKAALGGSSACMACGRLPARII